MNTKEKWFAWLFTILLSTTACDGSSDSGPADAAPSAIVRGNGGEPGSLDPALAEDVHAFNILTDLYEGLVAQSADGAIVPGAAESWTRSSDGLTYTFALRDDASWSNGEPVTSADFANAFRRATDAQTASSYVFLLEPIQDVVSVDEKTLVLTLAEPTPHILALLAMPIAFPTPASRDASASYSDPESFVGNGAYVLADHRVGELIRLRRNPAYWDAKSVAVDEIVYLAIVDPTTELNMYRAGDIDITNTIPPERVRSLRENMPEQVQISPLLALYYLAFDLTEPPLDNGLLRQALTMAIDREQLVALIGRGEQPAFSVVPHGVTGHVVSEFPWRHLSSKDRVRRARALFRQAGYSDESPLTIKYTYDSGDIHEKIALAVSSMWRDVLGVDVTLQKMEWQFFLETRDKRTEWQVMRFNWFGDYDHASTFTNIFRSGDRQNLSAYHEPEYDQLLASAAIEKDAARSAAQMTRAEAILLDDYPIAPLYFYVSKHLVRPDIGGFEPNVLDRHPSKYLYLKRKL